MSFKPETPLKFSKKQYHYMAHLQSHLLVTCSFDRQILKVLVGVSAIIVPKVWGGEEGVLMSRFIFLKDNILNFEVL